MLPKSLSSLKDRVRAPLVKQYISRWFFYAAGLAALCIIFAWHSKSWDTNDDAMMGMIVQGYGIAHAPSPGLVYSNVVWGWVLEQLGQVFGPYSYTYASYSLLLASLFCFMLAFERARVPAALGVAILLIGYYPIISGMQFTLVAGLLAASGVTLACTCGQKDRGILLLSGILLVLAGLVRGLELLFVLGASAPIGWFMFHGAEQKHERVALYALIAGVAGVLFVCFCIDASYYSTDAWSHARHMIVIVNKIVSYRMGGYFHLHPQVFAHSGLTKNDLYLMHNWFFADPDVFRESHFDLAFSKVHPLERMRQNLHFYRSYLRMFYYKQTLLFIVAIAIMWIFNSRKLAIVFALGILALTMTAFFLLGHLPASRVCIPVLMAIAGLTALNVPRDSRPIRFVSALMCLGMLIISLIPTLGRDNHADVTALKAHQEICSLPKDHPMVIWGVGKIFGYGHAYSPFNASGIDCKLQFYPIGAMQLIPPALDQLSALTGGYTSLIAALNAGQTFYFITSPERMDHLKIFFREHYHVTLSAEYVSEGKMFHNLYTVKVLKDVVSRATVPTLPAGVR